MKNRSISHRVADYRPLLVLGMIVVALAPAHSFAGEVLLAVDKVGQAFEFRDATTHAQIARIDLPARPHELVVAPDKKSAYVSIYGDGIYGNNTHPGHQVAVIDLVARKLDGFIDVGPFFAPHGLTLDRSGLLWVSCDKSSHVLVVDPKSRKVLTAIPTIVPGTHWIAAHPGGEKVYGSNKDNAFVYVFDVASRTIARKIPVPNGTEGIALSPDGKRLYASDHKLAKILVIDTTRDEVVAEADLRGYPEIPLYEDHEMRLKVSPDGEHLLVSAYKWDRAVVLKTADLSKQILLKTRKGPMGFAFPSDPARAFLADHDSGSISIIDLTKGEFIGSFDCGKGVETMEFIPAESRP